VFQDDYITAKDGTKIIASLSEICEACAGPCDPTTPCDNSGYHDGFLFDHHSMPSLRWNGLSRFVGVMYRTLWSSRNRKILALILVLWCFSFGVGMLASAPKFQGGGHRWCEYSGKVCPSSLTASDPLVGSKLSSSASSTSVSTVDSCAANTDPNTCLTTSGCGFCAGTGACKSTGNSASCAQGWSTITTQDLCAANSGCSSCNAVSGCGWCSSTNTCTDGSSSGPTSGSCSSWKYPDFWGNGCSGATGIASSGVCGSKLTATTCLTTSNCGW
jgi:hypothetical protein